MDCPDSSTSLDGDEQNLIICNSCAENIQISESCTDTDDSDSSLTIACECDSPFMSYEHLNLINDMLVRPQFCNILAEPYLAPQPFFAQEQFFQLPQTEQEIPLPNLPQQQFFNVTPLESARNVNVLDAANISTVWQNMNYEVQPQLLDPIASTVIVTPKLSPFSIESSPVYTNIAPFHSDLRMQSGIRPMDVEESSMRTKYTSNVTLPFSYFQSETYDPNYIQPIDAIQYDQFTSSGFTNPFHEADILNELSSPFQNSQIPNQYQSQMEQAYTEATAPQYDDQVLISYNNQGEQNLNDQIVFPSQTSVAPELQQYDNQFSSNYSPDVMEYSNANVEYENTIPQVSGTFSQNYNEPASPNESDYIQIPEFTSAIPQNENFDPNSSQVGTSTKDTASEDKQTFESNFVPSFSQTNEKPEIVTQPTNKSFTSAILEELNISPFPQPVDPPVFQFTSDLQNNTPYSNTQDENIAPLSFPISQPGSLGYYSESIPSQQPSQSPGKGGDISKRQDSGQMLLAPHIFESKISYVDPVFLRQQREEERQNDNKKL